MLDIQEVLKRDLPATPATPPPGWVFCICGCGGLVRDGGPDEEKAWARVFAEAGIEDPARQPSPSQLKVT